jgi:predicted RNA-binding protein
MTNSETHSPTRYWVGVASRNHVLKGIAGGFAQLCHGKQQPLKRMAKGDWIIYYSPQEIYGEKSTCQRFTAIGEVINNSVYQFEMSPDFTPFRRDVRFVSAQEICIRPLLDKLSFIKNKTSWGYAFRFGHLQIPETDFKLVQRTMTGNHKEEKLNDY